MIPFVNANEIVFCFTLLVYLLTLFLGSIIFAMSISYKLKIYYILPEVIISLLSISLFCHFADAIRIRYLGANIEEFTGSLCFMPLWSVILIGIILLISIILILILIVKKRLSSLTAMSVKESLTKISSGVCFYDETGRILLSNKQIQDECYEITGKSLYDGLEFWNNISCGEVKNNIKVNKKNDIVILESVDKAICYKQIIHNLDNRKIYEITGNDITYELSLKKVLEERNEDLKIMNLRLKKYGEIVSEIAKEKEVLKAKVNVHSNLGSLILRTKKSLAQESYDKDELINDWKDIMNLIFASTDEISKFDEVNKTAISLGVKVFYYGNKPPQNSNAYNIFASCIFESLINTARHADGNELYVKMSESVINYELVISNNGKKPTGEIKEGGGLSSIRTMTVNANGQMQITSKPKFTITILIPKEVNDAK